MLKIKIQKNNLKKNRGQVIILVALFTLFISAFVISIISSPVVGQLKTNRDLLQSEKSYFFSEGGNEDIIYRIRNGESISGQKVLSFDDGGSAVTTVTDLDDGVKEVTTVADYDNKIRKIESKIKTTSGVSFNYGLFAGQGGIDIGTDSVINGPVYSDGNITGSSGARISGDVYVAIPPATTTSMEWLSQNDSFDFARYFWKTDAFQSFKVVNSPSYLSKVAINIKKIGSPYNLKILIVGDRNGAPDPWNVLATGVLASNLVGSNYSYVEVGFDSSPELIPGNTYWIVADAIRSYSNYYVWSFDNTDDYVDGTGKYSANWAWYYPTNIGGDFNFKLWTSDNENNGVLDDVVVGDENWGGGYFARAHSITDSLVSGDAFATNFTGGIVIGSLVADTISNCIVTEDASYNTNLGCLLWGNEYSPTTPPNDPTYLASPISGANIDTWKSDATAGGVITTGNLILADGDSVGPGVIDGNLTIEAGATVTLGGTVYVKGNIDIGEGATLNLGISYGTDGSGAVISDGWIDLENNVILNSPRIGTGHLMLLTTANCDNYYGLLTCNSDNAAITVNNSVVADILVAPYGLIKMNNNTEAVSLIANTLWLNNNIVLNYELGLININFTSGPSGSWGVESWREVE